MNSIALNEGANAEICLVESPCRTLIVVMAVLITTISGVRSSGKEYHGCNTSVLSKLFPKLTYNINRFYWRHARTELNFRISEG